MKQITVEKFSGLAVQQNSLTVPPGSLEIADNVVLSQDFLLTKRRGFAYEHFFQDDINTVFEYSGYLFGLTGTYCVRLDGNDTGIGYTFSNSGKVIVRSASHGITSGDWIADFSSTSETFVSQFSGRYSAFCGLNQVQTAFTGLTASGNGTRVLVALVNHGQQTGDTVSLASSTLSVALGVTSIAACGSDAFSFLSTATGTGTVDLVTLDAFAISLGEIASSGVDSGASGVSYNHYSRLTGTQFSISSISRTLRSNKNLYFTTDNGLFCLESPTQSAVREAGIPPGLDLDGSLSGNSGAVNANAQAAWRVVFGLRDSNDNLHLGAPSEALLLTNPLTDVASTDVAYSSGTRVASITSPSHGFSSGDEVYLWSVELSPATAAVPDGSRAICTSINANTFSVDFDDVGVAPVTVSGLSYGRRKTAKLYASIPSEINTTDYLYQIYRVQSESADSIPEPRYKIIDEKQISTTDLSRGFIEYDDSLPEELVEGNAELYTNPTQEGESQANARPPLSADVVLFKNYVFFAANTQYRSLALACIAPQNITNGDTLTIAGSTYVFYGDGTYNLEVGNELTTSSGTTSSYVEVTQTSHGFSNGDYINVVSVSGITGITVGEYQISAVPTPNTFRFGTGASGSGTVTYEGTRTSGGNRIVKFWATSNINPVTTLSETIDRTARNLVKAVNRNAASALYAQYVSAIDEAPGNILFTAKDLDEPTFAATVSSATTGEAFQPVVPTSGTTVSDTQSVSPNELLVSKYLEPEAVPIVNVFPVGSKDAPILRIAALRDSLIILKTDGIYRLNGDNPATYTVTQLDGTVVLKASKSVAVLNNSVFAFTNQGVVQISDTSVRIISRQFEPLLTSVLKNPNLEEFTYGIAYESERLYLLATIAANTNPSQANIIYCYHYLTEGWTTWSGSNAIFSSGVIFSENDKAYLVTAANKGVLVAERKDQTKIDFTGQDQCLPILYKQPATAFCVSSSTHLTVQTIFNHGLKVGDVVTISSSDASLALVYGGGIADVEGIRVVVSKTAKTFTVASLSTSTGSATGNLYWQEGISEVNVTLDTTNGDAAVVVTTAQAHGLKTGNALTVLSVDATIASAFSGGATDITGYRTISVLSSTQFSINALNVAGSTVTGTGSLRDRRGQATIVTALTSTQPQVGDAIVTENRIYVIKSLTIFTTDVYVLTLDSDYKSLSTAESHVHDAYTSLIKFSPIHGGTGTLKLFAECQVWFRNQGSCSSAQILFGTDSQVASTKNAWRSDVGTPGAKTVFGGWGESAWGGFPWGGGLSIDRDFRSGPAVIWRMYVPRTAYLATWIQPTITHDTAGEPIEIQSIALLTLPGTTRTSK